MAIHYGPLFEYEIVSLKNHQNRFEKNGISNSLQKLLKYSIANSRQYVVFCFYISIWIFIEKKYHEIVVRRNFFSGFFWLLACFTTHSLSLQKFTGKQYDYNKPQFQIITNESLKHFVKLNYNLFDIYFCLKVQVIK